MRSQLLAHDDGSGSSEEEGADLVEEFYQDESGSNQQGSSLGTGKKPDLGEKLHHKAAELNGVEGAVAAL